MRNIAIAFALIAVLAACAPTDPIKRYSAAIDRVHTDGYPILIYNRPADDVLSFINVSSHPVSAVELKLAVCGSKGQTSADLARPYWLHVLVKGDFQAGFAFNVKGVKVTAIDASGTVINPDMQGFGWHSKIVAAWVRFSDGTDQRSFTDVHSFITPQVANDCSTAADPAHGADWLSSLVKG